MIQRYSLYLDPNELHGYVRGDAFGHWLKWVDVMDYVAYAVAHGFIPPVEEVETTPQLRVGMADDLLPEDLDDLESNDLDFDSEADVYDLMTNRIKHDAIEL